MFSFYYFGCEGFLHNSLMPMDGGYIPNGVVSYFYCVAKLLSTYLSLYQAFYKIETSTEVLKPIFMQFMVRTKHNI